MAKLRVDDVGSVGLVLDTAPWKIPQGAWTFLQNAYCRDSSVTLADGYGNLPLTVSENIEAIFSYNISGSEFYIVCGSSKVWVLSATTLYDITPLNFSFSYNADLGWDHVIFNGVFILNDGINQPYFWPLSAGGPSVTARLQPLSSVSDWPSNQSCTVLKSFNSALFAMGISRNGVQFPYLVLFSDFAEPGTLPSEWLASSTNSAGDFSIADTLDSIVDAILFKDSLLIFKERSVYGVRFIGGNFVYQCFSVNQSVGILARKCVTTSADVLVVITADDVMVSQGMEFSSIVSSRLRQDIFRKMDSMLYKRTYVLHDTISKSIWLVVPQEGQVGRFAYIWNYSNNTWQTRELNGFVSGTVGNFSTDSPSGTSGDTWNSIQGSWSSAQFPWKIPALGESSAKLIFAKRGSGVSNSIAFSTRLGDSSILDVFPAILERRWIPFPRGDVLDWDTVKFVTEVWPKFSVEGAWPTFSQGIKIWLAGQMSQDDPLEWKFIGEYFPGSFKKKLGARVSGRFISIRFEIPALTPWTLTGYDIEYKLQSRR